MYINYCGDTDYFARVLVCVRALCLLIHDLKTSL